MFTQEQLGALKSVVTEAVKPLTDGLEVRLIERMDDGFNKMDEKMDFIEKRLDEKIDKGFDQLRGDINHMKGDIAILLDTTTRTEEKVDEIGGSMLVIKDDLRRLKANSSIWVVRDEGDDPYSPSK